MGLFRNSSPILRGKYIIRSGSVSLRFSQMQRFPPRNRTKQLDRCGNLIGRDAGQISDRDKQIDATVCLHLKNNDVYK